MAGKTGAGTAEAEMTGAMRAGAMGAGAEMKGKGPGMDGAGTGTGRTGGAGVGAKRYNIEYKMLYLYWERQAYVRIPLVGQKGCNIEWEECQAEVRHKMHENRQRL